jgi:hypothetical protein
VKSKKFTLQHLIDEKFEKNNFDYSDNLHLQIADSNLTIATAGYERVNGELKNRIKVMKVKITDW